MRLAQNKRGGMFIFRGLGQIILASLLVSGCQMGLENATIFSQKKERAVTFASGVKIDAPDQYCLVPKMTRNNGRQGFGVFAPCNSIGPAQSIVTVSATPLPNASRPKRDAMRKAMMARKTAKDHRDVEGIQIVHFIDPKAAKRLGMQPDFWRAMVYRNGTLIVASYYGHTAKDATETLAEARLLNLINKLPKPIRKTTAGVSNTSKVNYLATAPMLKPIYRP